MSKPGKSAHRGLLSIDDTINNRVALNIEFKYWITQFGINVPMFQNCFRDSQRNAIYLEERIVNIPSSVRK